MSANIFGSAEDISSSTQSTETGTIRSGRTRVFGVYLDSGTASGDFHLRDGGASGTVKFKYKTSGVTSGGSPIVINFPGPILFETDLCVAFTTEHVTVCSVFYN